jgi:hypothetical protein
MRYTRLLWREGVGCWLSVEPRLALRAAGWRESRQQISLIQRRNQMSSLNCIILFYFRIEVQLPNIELAQRERGCFREKACDP